MAVSACREAEQAVPAGPAYCRYVAQGPLCFEYDPSAVPFVAELRLRPLADLESADRGLVERHVAAMAPRPRSANVLAPVGPFPAGRMPVPDRLPEELHGPANPRLAVLALETAPGRVDVQALVLAEDRIVSTGLLAQGLRAASLRGRARNGFLRMGFSLTDDPRGLGDHFRLREGLTSSRGLPDLDAWAAQLSWERIAADSPRRKTHFFESIVNNGSCAGSTADMPVLLAPVPREWLAEYEASCPTRPPPAHLRRLAQGW